MAIIIILGNSNTSSILYGTNYNTVKGLADKVRSTESKNQKDMMVRDFVNKAIDEKDCEAAELLLRELAGIVRTWYHQFDIYLRCKGDINLARTFLDTEIKLFGETGHLGDNEMIGLLNNRIAVAVSENEYKQLNQKLLDYLLKYKAKEWKALWPYYMKSGRNREALESFQMSFGTGPYLPDLFSPYEFLYLALTDPEFVSQYNYLTSGNPLIFKDRYLKGYSKPLPKVKTSF